VDLVFKSGPMEVNMKESGVMTRLTEKVSFGTQTEIFMKASGSMIKLMDMAYMFITMELAI